MNPPYDLLIRPPFADVTASENRALVLLPYHLSAPPYLRQNARSITFSVSVVARFRGRALSIAAGFRLGRQGDTEIRDWRRAVLYATQYVDILYYPRAGSVRIKDTVTFLTRAQRRVLSSADAIALTFACAALSRRVLSCSLTLHAANDKEKRVTVRKMFTDGGVLTGHLSLLTDGPGKDISEVQRKAVVRFADFSLSGSGAIVRYIPKRTLGPILWTQFAPPQRRVLRLQAQLAYLPAPQRASLHLRTTANNGTRWSLARTASMDADSKTVLFVTRMPRGAKRVQYRVSVRFNGAAYRWFGTVSIAPRSKRRLRIASFSCDKGYLFPQASLVRTVETQRPDLLAFLGDQIYESSNMPGLFGVARMRGPLRIPLLDFFYKVTTFGWTWRTLLRSTPAVMLVDDHDVFQGNLFGAGGASLPISTINWARGGYIMAPRWVRAVERVYAGHLPPSPRRQPVGKLQLRAYYTTFTYGAVSFAVLEDRKFKNGPSATNPSLLGAKQEQFLERWANDWADSNVQMKVALSQTVFAAVATHGGFDLTRNRYYLDSGGWPRSQRDTAVRALTRARAFSLHGDQHLGMLLRNYPEEGDEHGQLAFMVPGTANYFPRAWWPGVGAPSVLAIRRKSFTGRFVDEGGHAVNVLAVSNPDYAKRRGRRLSGDWWQIAYDKSSGWGLSIVDTKKRTVNVKLFRVGGGVREMFPGFPRIVFVGGRKEALAQRKLDQQNAKAQGQDKAGNNQSAGDQSTGFNHHDVF